MLMQMTKRVVCVLVLVSGLVQAATITVPGDQPTIQDGIDAAANSDEVLVSPGTYVELINFNGKAITLRSASGDPNDTIIDGDGLGSVVTCENQETAATMLEGFTITNGSANYGGGMYNFGSSPTISNCIFKGNTASRFGGGMFNFSASPILTDCTFSNNTADSYGGGIYNFSSSPILTDCTFSSNTGSSKGGGMYNTHFSRPTLTYCTFSDNTASFHGGGMYGDSSSTLTNCTFNNNTATSGGGLWCLSGSILTNCTFSGNVATSGGSSTARGGGISSHGLTLTNCTFSDNTANSGGGLHNGGSGSTLTNCTFSGNTANFEGGGMYNVFDSPILVNCTFSGNIAIDGGGLFSIVGTSSPTVINSTFSGNTASNNGGGINISAFSSATLINSIIWGNSDVSGTSESAQIYSESEEVMVSYCNVQNGWTGIGGIGNIDMDPLFVDANGEDDILGTEDDDLRLLAGSPCIDAGDTDEVIEIDSVDQDGNPRAPDDPDTVDTGVSIPVTLTGNTAIVDLGAYEYQPDLPCRSLIEGDINCDGKVDHLDVRLLAQKLNQHRATGKK